VFCRTKSSPFAPLAVAVTFAMSGCGSSVDDPAAARCNAPDVTFGRTVVLGDHTEVGVHFQCLGAVQAGTLYLPTRARRVPALVYVPGSGPALRWGWQVPWVRMTVRAGMAFLSYDKRGAGRSQGECCPGDDDHFNLLAADADGALEAARRGPGIDSRRVGFLGTSQAGWVVPLAIARNPDHVAFTALVDAPAVTTNEEHQWSDLAGEEAEHPPPLTPAKKKEIERKLRPSGFDPVPLLGRMTMPGIWLYGGQDRSQPANRSAARLGRLRTSQGKDFTIVVFPRADHGLLDTPPTDARAMPTVLAWLREHARA
jgi:uncharacterized protein